MPGIIQQGGYSEGRGVLVFFTFVVAVLITGLLVPPQKAPMAASLWANAVQDDVQQKNRMEKIRSTSMPGTTFIYSFQPWGGVRSDDAEKSLFAMWDVSILPWRSRAVLSTAAHIGMAAELENGLKRGAIRPSVQFFRLRNPNWMPTS